MSAIAKLVEGTAEVLDEVYDLDLPVNPADTHELLHAVDQLLAAGAKLQRHLAYHPEARIDRHLRCHQCGRALAFPPRPRLWGDGGRGCAFLPAAVAAHLLWATNFAMSVPYVGKAIWWLRRRGCGS